MTSYKFQRQQVHRKACFLKSWKTPRWSDTTRRISSLRSESLAMFAYSGISLIHLSAKSFTTFRSLKTLCIILHSSVSLQPVTPPCIYCPTAPSINKIYEFVSLFRNRCHKIASDRETCPIIRETAKRTMHLYRGIEFKTLYAYLPLPTSSRCCG